MRLQDLKPFFVDLGLDVGVPEIDSNVGQKLTEYFKVLDRAFEVRRDKAGSEEREFQKLIQDPDCFLFAIHVNAEQRLRDLGLDETIWREITPCFKSWGVEFSATERAQKELGLRGEHLDQKWNAWEAAEIAAATHHGMSIRDPHSAFLLGEFVGTLISPRRRLELREIQKALMKEIAHRRRPNAQGKTRSHLKQLVLRMKEEQKSLTAQMVINEFKKSASGAPSLKVEEAIKKDPKLRIEIQEVTEAPVWREGVIFFIANRREQSVQFKKVRDWLSSPKRDAISPSREKEHHPPAEVVPLSG